MPITVLNTCHAINISLNGEKKYKSTLAIQVPEESEQEDNNMMMAEPGQQSSSLKNIWPCHVLPDFPHFWL